MWLMAPTVDSRAVVAWYREDLCSYLLYSPVCGSHRQDRLLLQDGCWSHTMNPHLRQQEGTWAEGLVPSLFRSLLPVLHKTFNFHLTQNLVTWLH